MKRFWALILAFTLVMSIASALAQGGKYDASGCDTATNDDGTISILGIPGDPVPITWGELSALDSYSACGGVK